MKKISKGIRFLIANDYMNPKIYLTDLCEKYGVSLSTIRSIAIENNLPTKKPLLKRIRKSQYKINENYFENIDCENKAYWLGFIAADFHIGKNPINNTLFLKGELKSTDIEILENLQKDLEADQKIKIVDRFNKTTNKTYNHCLFCIYNQKICSDIIKHGITMNKSKELFIPNISNDLIRHFIRGYFDGDGSFHTRRNTITFSLISSTETILNEIRDNLNKNCKIDHPKVNKLKNANAYTIAYEGNLQVKEIYNYLYNDC